MEATVPVRADAADEDFDEWFRWAWPRLVVAVTVHTGDRSLAEDAVAVAVTKVHDRWPEIRSRRPEAWAFRVAVNQARRSWRRWSRMHHLTEVPSPEVVAELRDLDLWAAVGALPRREREAVLRRYVLDQTQAEAAAAMNVSPGTVATLLHRARAHLADKDLTL